MAERIINISFEITDNWARGEFRELIKGLIKYPEKYNVYILSNDDSSAYIQSVANVLKRATPDWNKNDDHTLIVGFTNDKITTIDQYKIDIHLDNLLYVVTQIEEETEAYAIYVNELPNKYDVEPTYIVELERAVERILNG